jgi:hypothetical protein
MFRFDGGIFATASSTFTGTTTFRGKTLGAGIYGEWVASTTITVPQAVYLATTTNALLLSDANDNIASDFLGFAVTGASNGATTTVQLDGIVSGFTGLTRGAKYYVSDTAGSISTSGGTNEIYVGRAISPTEIMILKDTDSSWQYLGTASVRANNYPGGATHLSSSTIPTIARFMVVDAYCVGTGSNVTKRSELIVFKKGAGTAGDVSSGFTQPDTSGGMRVAASYATDLLTITCVASGSGVGVIGSTHNVYLYR